ncbi:MAG TPA: RecX family transcriptional regulator [Bacteroidia bacterium]|nr:RecX family transcriptional regulator [Bacteroidia bacterium]
MSFSHSEAYRKALHYCTYRERSQQEVRDKLYSLGLHSNDVENVIADLITAGFLNEERFARAYCRGKFRINGWGKNKIRNGLLQKKVSPKCIELGLSEIKEADYIAELKKNLSEKLNSKGETNLLKKKHSAAQFAIGKGFESGLVWEILKEME